MGEVKQPIPVKLIVGMLSSEEELFSQAEDMMSQRFGSIDFKSSLLLFNFTSYYEKEMGKGLKRKFVSFKKLINPAKIVEAKLFTNKLEKKFLYPHSHNRCLNLDPGYLTFSKIVLATTKDYQHRLYLGKGIYAEVTLRYKREKGFTSWEWTYPDYRSSEYLKIFEHLREIYTRQVKIGGETIKSFTAY
ncbi:MAG: DUF4416 family protein [Candidatus Aerophobetes bacterium]|nr:DUF4416 family protein [Candidatus Aerophobetes bacterium]